MNELMNLINEQLEMFKTNATAYSDKGNKAAAARARKASLELTKLFKDFRKASIEESKN